MAKFWTNISAKDPRAAAEQAARLERDGWDGAVLYDSQCLFPEAWSAVTLCAAATKTITLATGMTNPITRHPSVTASAAATVQLISGGRFILGIGRGDSALAYVGAAPMAIGRFEAYLEMLQTYLRGDLVPLEEAAALLQDAERNFDKLALHAAPPGSSITWLKDFDLPKVPLEAAVTGPKAIESAARVADGVVLGVTADVDRISWGLETARRAAKAAGRDPASIESAAYLCVAPNPDVRVARDMARGLVATMARFSVMSNKVVGPAGEKQQATLEKIAKVYDMNKHGEGGAQGAVVDDEFVDQAAIVGPSEHCIARLRALMDLGVDRFTISLPHGDTPELKQAYAMLSEEILPALRR